MILLNSKAHYFREDKNLLALFFLGNVFYFENKKEKIKLSNKSKFSSCSLFVVYSRDRFFLLTSKKQKKKESSRVKLEKLSNLSNQKNPCHDGDRFVSFEKLSQRCRCRQCQRKVIRTGGTAMKS